MDDAEEEKAWREQCRAQLQRDVMTRIKYGFCHVHKPILDDAPLRAFATMQDYRDWCEAALPAYLGYGRPPAQPAACPSAVGAACLQAAAREEA